MNHFALLNTQSPPMLLDRLLEAFFEILRLDRDRRHGVVDSAHRAETHIPEVLQRAFHLVEILFLRRHVCLNFLNDILFYFVATLLLQGILLLKAVLRLRLALISDC